MIRFACLCKNRFEVADDTAGGMIQCPACGRLNDVPTLSDVPHLDDDGTYRVDVERPQDDPIRLAELGIVYAKGSRDAEGDEIDLRTTPGEVSGVGADQDDEGIPLREDVDLTSRRLAPKYDPETGELIQPLDLVNNAEPVSATAIPMAKAAISYAVGDPLKRVSPWRVLVELLMPVNVMVLAIVFVSHVLLQVAVMVMMATLLVLKPVVLLLFVLPLAGMIISHYGNVMEEVGPQEKDELPRPLRNLSFSEDLWGPFVNVAGAVMMCYLPAAIVAAKLEAGPAWLRLWLIVGLAGLGTLFFPAVLLTTTTSGSLLNLRPDRLIGVMRTCGLHYGMALLTFVVTAVLYSVAMVAADNAFIRVTGGTTAQLPWWQDWWVGYPLLSIAIYCAHFFCWFMAVMYRAHHQQFPWILQRFIPDPAVQARRFGSRGRPAAEGDERNPRFPRKDTKTKLRELRELERKRRAQQQRQAKSVVEE